MFFQMQGKTILSCFLYTVSLHLLLLFRVKVERIERNWSSLTSMLLFPNPTSLEEAAYSEKRDCFSIG